MGKVGRRKRRKSTDSEAGQAERKTSKRGAPKEKGASVCRQPTKTVSDLLWWARGEKDPPDSAGRPSGPPKRLAHKRKDQRGERGRVKTIRYRRVLARECSTRGTSNGEARSRVRITVREGT